MHSSLQVYNSLTRQQEVFKPVNPPYVGMYVCGPTVYGLSHIGHARCYITFDVIQRYLKHLGYQVRYVRNITDVGHLERDGDEGEDKIAKQAQLEKLEPMEVVQRYMNSFHNDMALLNVQPPSIEPQASGHIPEQIQIIQQIIDQGLAYESNGSVYFNITAYEKKREYGKLSGRNIHDLLAGTRVLAGQSEKKFPLDFALWKKANKTHIMRWPSPWGEGFPGWHIECTALATKYLGPYFDIHGGGIDLLFPHHECEIAQSQAVQSTTLAKYWLHNNLVMIHDHKMSKSLGNFITLEELFQGIHPLLSQAYSPMVLRFFVLQAHYRSTLSFSNEALQASEKGYLKLINGLRVVKKMSYTPSNLGNPNPDAISQIEQYVASCYQAINDDFNTAKLIAELFQLLRFIYALEYKQIDFYKLGKTTFELLKKTYILFVEDILGLQEHCKAAPQEFLSVILKMYAQAKQQKNYEQIDLLRAELKKLNIMLHDTARGVDWSYI
ncbi:MAG: cysteine--tRNA ligase [Candidatus Amoebophilus sp. 36-38]|nr:MAG: cysteine--tRNA ligase [Candidatus Amoebophilus sp. 36-38]